MENTQKVNGLTFDQWMSKVNHICASMIGLDADELPDICYWDLWESGCSPKEAVYECLENDDLDWMSALM